VDHRRPEALKEVRMPRIPPSVSRFLEGRRFAVAGVARRGDTAANAVFRKLRDAGYEVVPVNPNAGEIEGTTCYPDLGSVPGELDGVVVATHPRVSVDLVRQAHASGVPRVWFHRSIGQGSVSQEAVDECARLGLECIVGGCPLMFCEPVDLGHKCMRWWFQRSGKVPTS
jgi:predicted CoA-binding protein